MQVLAPFLHGQMLSRLPGFNGKVSLEAQLCQLVKCRLCGSQAILTPFMLGEECWNSQRIICKARTIASAEELTNSNSFFPVGIPHIIIKSFLPVGFAH